MIVRIAVLCLVLFSTATFAADEVLTQRFNEAQRLFLDTQDYPESQEHLEAARSAYEIGLELFPKNETLATLALNFGILETSYSEAAQEALLLAERILTDIHGPDSPGLVDIHMGLGKMELIRQEPLKARNHYRNAVAVAEKHSDDPLLLGNLHLKIARSMLSYRNQNADEMAKQALELFAQVPDQPGIDGQVNAGRILGNHYLQRGQSKKALETLNKALALGTEHNTDPYVRQLIHASLARHFESRNQHDEVTQQLQEIGRIKLLVGDASMDPLIQIRPNYPPNALRRGIEGWVHLKFTVDETGTVQGPEVVDIEGEPEFGTAAKQALKGFRFAPRFENGAPASTPDVEYIFRFNLDE